MYRRPTQYRKIPIERNVDETVDDIELLERQPAQGVQDNIPALTPKPTGGDSYDVKESTTRLLNSASGGILTAYDNYPERRDGSIKYRLPPRPAKHRFLSGWRVGVLVSLIGAVSVCIINLAITMWVWKRGHRDMAGGIGTVFEGNCMKARKTNVWIHLVVNILSTLLLSASNYCMQVLSAPNREELVNAHARRYWLHIGVPSLRNIRHIGRDRALIWITLFLSSFPLHLLFNSVVFTNLQSNKYAVVPTMEDWLMGERYNDSASTELSATTINEINMFRPNLTDRVDMGGGNLVQRYQNFSTATCFEKYNEQYISDSGNLYLVQDGPTIWRNLGMEIPVFNLSGQFTWHDEQAYENNLNRGDSTAGYPNYDDKMLPFLSTPEYYPSNGWRCPSRVSATCDIENEFEVPSDRSRWQPYERPVRYCMIEQVREFCKLQFSFPIAITVIVSNFIKAICMALLLFGYRRHTPLVTLGDTVANFLDHPDPETRGRCLHTRRLFEAEWNWEKHNGAKKEALGIEPEPFDLLRVRWGLAPSRGRWFATYSLYFIAIIFGIVCITLSLRGMPRDPVKLWKIGFGTIQGNNLMSISTSLMGGILMANLPQALLSYLYVAFNALYTNMFVAKEWAGYSSSRKPLRVSTPTGQQRNTYWLNVPFRYAIPITAVSGLFHWLASQSIFMVQINVTDEHTRAISKRISTCGFSPVAIILTTSLGTAIAVAGLLVARLRYPPGIPLASSCSAAISAACHPTPADTDASRAPVQWGAIPGSERVVDGRVIGHCSFSSFAVELPVSGRFYA